MPNSQIIERLEKVYKECSNQTEHIQKYTDEEKIEMKLALYEKTENGELSIENRDRLLSQL